MARERILVGGAPGSGKTYAWLTIARMFPNNTFHVIDPDDGVIRVWKEIDKKDKPVFGDVNNINYFFTPVWDEKLTQIEFGRTGGVDNAFKEIKKVVKDNDWVIVESLDGLWDMAQGSFVSEVFEKGIGEYFLERRKALTDKSTRLDAFDGWKDWVVIKKRHNDDLIVPICYQLHVNVYMTTGLSITTPREASKEDAESRAFYGDTLLRLEGEKRNGRRVQSIFTFTKTREGWIYSTFLKDRGRSWVENESLIDFGLQYLGIVAGY